MKRNGSTDSTKNYDDKEDSRKRSGKGRGGKRSSKPGNRGNGRSSNGRSSEYDPKPEGTQDAAWHGNAYLLQAAASFPYAYSVGGRYKWDNPLFYKQNILPSESVPLDTFTVPGLVTFEVTPVYPSNGDLNDPLNVAGQSQFSFIRHANSGARNYKSPDLIIYDVCMDQIYAYINWLMRIYGNARKFTITNQYYGQALLQSENIDADDVRSHLMDFYGGINVLIDKAAQFAVPGNMPVFKRHSMLYQAIYCEGDSIKDQLYMYTPSGFYGYAYDATTSAGSAQFIPRSVIEDLADPTNPNSKKLTVRKLLDFGTNLVNRFLQDDDFALISGDTLKAYGDNILKLVAMPIDYNTPTYTDLNVLECMKNATCVQSLTIGNLTQDPTTNQLSQNIWGTYNPATDLYEINTTNLSLRLYQMGCLQAMCENRVISTIRTEPKPEDTMEITRHTVGARNFRVLDTPNDRGDMALVDLICSSDIITRAKYWAWEYDATTTTWQLSFRQSVYAMPGGAALKSNSTGVEVLDTWYDFFRDTARWTAFKFHPAIHAMLFSREQGTSDYAGLIVTSAKLFFDVDNYTILNNNNLDQLHNADIMYMYGIDAVAKSN